MRSASGLAAGLLLATVAAVAGLSAPARAHTLPETRRVLLEPAADRTQLVIHWTLPTGQDAALLRERLDGDGDRRLRQPAERLGLGMLLLPRIQKGLGLWIAGRPVAVTLKDVRVKDAPWQGPRTGFEALALFEAPAAPPGAELVVTWQAGPETRIEAQAGPGRQIARGALPNRPGDPVWGPLRLGPTRLQAAITLASAPAAAPSAAAPTAAPARPPVVVPPPTPDDR